MPQYLKQYGERLVELGYRIVPLPPESKGPKRKGWPQFDPDAAQVRQWYANGSANDGIGILARYTPAIDVDILDPIAAQEMSDLIDGIFPGQALMTRTGRAPKFLIPFRSDDPFKKLSSSVYTDGTHDHKVEILGDGQQWVAYHIHPETGLPYAWFDGLDTDGILSLERSELPVLTREDAQRVIDAFEVLAAARVASGQWSVRVAVVSAERISSAHADDPFGDQPVGKSETEVRDLLARHPNEEADYDHWFKVLAAVHHELGEAGEDIARAWSTEAHKHTDEKFDTTWNSLGRYTGRQLTLRSLLKGEKPTPEPTEADKAFKFYAGDDYAVDFNAAPEIVEDVLPDRGIVMVYGPSGKGKTFWTLDLAFHVHNGVKWRDKDVVRGDVMYVAAEAGRGIKKRIQAVKRLNPGWRSPFIADIAPDLASAVSLEAVRDAALAVGKPSIIVIDTMSASFEGDDSSQQDIAKMMRNLKTLSDALECLVVFVHHTTKDGASYRGSGVLFANVDAVLELVSEGEGSARKQWITQRKHREGEDGKSYPFSLKISEPLALKPNGKPITSCTIEQEDYKPAAKAEKKPRGGEFETSQVYATARYFLGIIQEEVGLGNANVSEDDVIQAIQQDEKDNKSGFEDYPPPSNIKRTLLTLAKQGKIRKEGRWIRLC
jgi:KaiC/GvpD/RAD55 family RecA-like ATPase